MTKCSKQMRILAGRIATYEALSKYNKSQKLGFPVFEKLRIHLEALMGVAGFRALLLRALALAAAESPWLGSVHVKPNGSLEWPDESDNKSSDSGDAFQGGVVLLANLIALLKTFIGELLTLRIVHDIWPKIPLNDWDFGNGDKHEKAK